MFKKYFDVTQCSGNIVVEFKDPPTVSGIFDLYNNLLTRGFNPSWIVIDDEGYELRETSDDTISVHYNSTTQRFDVTHRFTPPPTPKSIRGTFTLKKDFHGNT
jgi:hypothetical protein